MIYFLDLLQYHFDPHTGAWEHKQFKKDHRETLFSLHDLNYHETGMTVSTKEVCKDYQGTLDVSNSLSSNYNRKPLIPEKKTSHITCGCFKMYHCQAGAFSCHFRILLRQQSEFSTRQLI